MDIGEQTLKTRTLEDQIECELDRIESHMSDEICFDYETKEIYIIPEIHTEFDVDYCVLCGYTQYNHQKKTHKFIRCKEQHRCISCRKFFFEHNHVNSCYQPYIPVQMDEK